MELLVTGGYEDGSGECFVDRVDPSGLRERVVSFTPPERHRVPSKGFTGAAWLDGDLLVCSFDAVWRFNPNGKLLGRIHQPDANDLHDVAVLANGRIAVCNTGPLCANVSETRVRVVFSVEGAGRIADDQAVEEPCRRGSPGVGIHGAEPSRAQRGWA